jgi:hypothetical protein
MNWSFLLQFSLFFGAKAFSAACCGGGFASPTIIAGDQQTQLTLSYSYNAVTVDNVDSSGYWRSWSTHQDIQSYRLEGATLLSDRLQAGLAVPVVNRSRLGQSYSGLADVAATLGYEYLPDWDYNPIRPKGIGYLQVTLPTGFSKYESEMGGLDSRGNGFFSLGLGTLLTKAFGSFDSFISLEAHRSFSKSVSTQMVSGQIQPGFGGNFGIGGGYSIKSFRFGGAITWTVEQPVDIVQSSGNISGSVERYATGALSLSLMNSDDWSETLTYTDQTWFGSPLNTSLGRGLVFQLQRRWLR